MKVTYQGLVYEVGKVGVSQHNWLKVRADDGRVVKVPLGIAEAADAVRLLHRPVTVEVNIEDTGGNPNDRRP